MAHGLLNSFELGNCNGGLNAGNSLSPFSHTILPSCIRCRAQGENCPGLILRFRDLIIVVHSRVGVDVACFPLYRFTPKPLREDGPFANLDQSLPTWGLLLPLSTVMTCQSTDGLLWAHPVS